MRMIDAAPKPRIWSFPQLGFLAIVLQIASASCVFAFQSFEEFTRSRNKLYNVEVKAIAEPVQAQPGDVLHLYLLVEISPGWHIYSLEEQGGDASLATRFRFDENPFQQGRPWQEPEPIITMDGALNRVVKIHKDAVQFSQEQFVPENLTPGNYSISGKIVFRACDNRICSLPRETDFKTHVRITAK